MYREKLILGFCGLLLLVASSAAQNFNFVSIDVPCTAFPAGAPCPTNTNGQSARTALGGINPAGDIVGVYNDGAGKQHGFVLRDGKFTSIDFPGELIGVGGNLQTVARGINPAGDIVGSFNAPYDPPRSTTADVNSPEYCPFPPSNPRSAACTKGFLYHRGRFSAVLFPSHPGAIPGAITPDGSIYGCLHDYDTMGSMFSAAWIRSGHTITYTSIAAGGGGLADPNQSYPNSMHGGATPDGRVVTGFYVDMSVTPNHTHGYIIQNGVLQTYDIPGSTATTVWDINPGLEIVGTYIDTGKVQHGFMQLPGSAPVTVDAPAVAPFYAVKTVFQGVNPAGVLTGQYTDTHGRTHGLVAIPSTEN